eukprot:CAMPEP_0174887892 /NCGR_PEP_ID=MMETSP0167-20121228/3125_1 /TAXON_ID=38298 /ORGANISM="Rhodella maculata, Strain CCMP736" /LENGTH=72 /DNA_ID=CAMNT_0016124587 /DNA_START=446 /DNA_END=664 /DNA_ORIENTATION=-
MSRRSSCMIGESLYRAGCEGLGVGHVRASSGMLVMQGVGKVDRVEDWLCPSSHGVGCGVGGVNGLAGDVIGE